MSSVESDRIIEFRMYFSSSINPFLRENQICYAIKFKKFRSY